jgi:hypothetical protein
MPSNVTTLPPSRTRLSEVRKKLKAKISLLDAVHRYVEFDADSLRLLGRSGGWLQLFNEEIRGQMQPADELWIFDADETEWLALHGERGLALVRSGEVVSFLLECRN